MIDAPPQLRAPDLGETVTTTERLILRRFREDDLEAWHGYMSIPDVCRWIPPEPHDLDWQRNRLREVLDTPWWDYDADRRIINLAVERREDGRLIGDVIFMASSDPLHRQSEFGYVFHPDVSGQGYATEAVRAQLTWGFANLGLHRAFARVDTENVASWRLLERLGLRREAELRHNEWFKGRWGDEYDYAVLEDEWAALSSPAAG